VLSHMDVIAHEAFGEAYDADDEFTVQGASQTGSSTLHTGYDNDDDDVDDDGN